MRNFLFYNLPYPNFEASISTIRKADRSDIPKHGNFFTKVLIIFMTDVISSLHGGGFFLSLENNGTQIILIFVIKYAL